MAGAFNYSRAVREWAFVQAPLRSLPDFRKAATARGLMADGSPYDTSAWETLDREDLLPPVAYALHGFWSHDQREHLARGDLIIREERGYVAWEELRAEADRRGDALNPTGLYVLYGALAAPEPRDNRRSPHRVHAARGARRRPRRVRRRAPGVHRRA